MDKAHSYFEMHVGFAAGTDTTGLPQFLADWKSLKFGKIIRPLTDKIYDRHDIQGGITYLLTRTTSNLGDVEPVVLSLREVLAQHLDARVEVEEVIYGPCMSPIPNKETQYRLSVPDELDVVVDIPKYESHISIYNWSGAPISEAKVCESLDHLDIQFHELAISAGAEKAILTFFHDDAVLMNLSTLHYANALVGASRGSWRTKVTGERILLCAAGRPKVNG